MVSSRMSRPPVTGAQRRRYENRIRHPNPTKATIAAILRALNEAGAQHPYLENDGPGTVVVMADAFDGGTIGGRATIGDHPNYAVAIMYAGAACIRALIEAKR